MPLSQRAPARRRFKRVLTVRHLAAQTAWLDTPPRWHEGRVCWAIEGGKDASYKTPQPRDLAAAERTLNKIQKYPRALENAFGNDEQSGADWLAQRRARLEQVKVLVRLNAPDLTALARPSHTRNPDTVRRLVELLLAEALCLNELPVSPAKTLARWPNDEVSVPLAALISDNTLPREVRALAALVAGTRIGAEPPIADKNLRAIFYYARQNRLPQAPALSVQLLLAEDGAALAIRAEAALGAVSRLEMDATFWREMLFASRALGEVVESLEAVASCERILLRLIQEESRADKLPFARLGGVPYILSELRVERGANANKFTSLLRNCALENNAALIVELRDFTTALLNFGSAVALWAAPSADHRGKFDDPLSWLRLQGALRSHILFVLQEVYNLPPSRRIGALRLLSENFTQIWDIEKLPRAKRSCNAANLCATFLRSSWNVRGRPFIWLLRHTDETTARDALAMDVAHLFYHYTWRDPASGSWMLDLFREFVTDIAAAPSWDLLHVQSVINSFESLEQGQATLTPLLEALQRAYANVSVYANVRQRLFLLVINQLNDDKNMRRTALRLSYYMAPAARFLNSAMDDWEISSLLQAILILHTEAHESARRENERVIQESYEQNEKFFDTAALLKENSDGQDTHAQTPDEGFGKTLANENSSTEQAEIKAEPDLRDWVDWIVNDLLRTRPLNKEDSEPMYYGRLEEAVRLAWTLSGSNFACFQRIFHVVSRQNFENSERFLQGVRRLHPYAAIRPALASMFPQQPTHCISILSRLGMSERLGNVMQPLDVFREEPSVLPLAWRPLAELIPDEWQSIAQLARAQSVRGHDWQMPPGLQSVLDWPRKMESERVHLAQHHAQTPRDHWAARLANLDKRLGDRENLRREMAAELREKLHDAAARAMLEALEEQIAQCYRVRLDEIAGPLPDKLHLDEDWLNAALLSVDIHSNRKLLRALLRAEVRGERSWRENHPGNVKFLGELAASGVNVQNWMAPHRRRFLASHGPFHLRLEARPLAILQMGNYFDTCLSFGNCNAFSTVANACELNKRVIFAHDTKGRVVGRKLIGLNEDGHLIGFHTYTSLKNTEANRQLRRVFARYCEQFAADCGLTMAEEGTVPKLFAEHWYDDGVVNWNYEEDKKPKPDVKQNIKQSNGSVSKKA